MPSKESLEICKKYHETCVKYLPILKEMQKNLKNLKNDFPIDATCITFGTVEESINNINDLIDWCEGTLETTPFDYI